MRKLEEDEKVLIWLAVDSLVGRAVACAEQVRSSVKDVHQITCIGSYTDENRHKVPAIKIMQTKLKVALTDDLTETHSVKAFKGYLPEKRNVSPNPFLYERAKRKK
ncbi:hypothetical protein ACOME3_004193 [Neoechinorhynchus agilis]